MAPKKTAQVDRGEVTIDLHPAPAYAYRSDRPELSGYTFIGATPEAAITNARAFLTHYYKVRHYWPINLEIKDDNGSVERA